MPPEDAMLWQWAFATSPAPYGLGLSESQFWLSTPRQLDLSVELWSNYQATFHNAHFHDPDGLGWTAEDFRDPGARELRKAQQRRDKAAVVMANQRITSMRPGDTTG